MRRQFKVFIFLISFLFLKYHEGCVGLRYLYKILKCFNLFPTDSDAAGKHKQLPVISKQMINFSADKGLFQMSAVPLHLKIHGKTLFWVLFGTRIILPMFKLKI